MLLASKKATYCLLSCFVARIALLLAQLFAFLLVLRLCLSTQQSNNAKKQTKIISKEATKQKSNVNFHAKKQQRATKQQVRRAKKQLAQQSNSKKATQEKKQKERNFPIFIFLSFFSFLSACVGWRPIRQNLRENVKSEN